jgi:hypothetical protein
MVVENFFWSHCEASQLKEDATAYERRRHLGEGVRAMIGAPVRAMIGAPVQTAVW